MSDKAPELMSYLNTKFLITITKLKGFRSGLTLPSGSVIHVSGSKVHEKVGGFYALTYKKYKDLISRSNAFYAIILEGANNTFVLPGTKVNDIFTNVDHGLDKEWHYTIKRIDDHYVLRANMTGGKYHLSIILRSF